MEWDFDGLASGRHQADFCPHLSTLSKCGQVWTRLAPVRPHGHNVGELATAQSSRATSQLSEKSYGIKIGSVVAENEGFLSTLVHTWGRPTDLEKVWTSVDDCISRFCFVLGDY